MGTNPDASGSAPRSVPFRTAVVGAGLAGLSCAQLLREAGHEPCLFEKSRGPSGRAATRRGDGWACDHGAQYFTADDPGFAAQVLRWCEAGVAAEWTPRLEVFGEAPDARRRDVPTRRFVGLPGMTAPARWMAAAHQVELCHTIDALRREHGAWRLRSREQGWSRQAFDAVLLAMPAPQAAVLLQGVHEEMARRAASADMQPCWSVMAVYDVDPQPRFDAAFVNQSVLSWVCAEHRKPGRGGTPCWVLHAQAAWSREHLEAPPEQVIEALLQAFQGLGARAMPRHAVAHRWRYARGTLADAPPALWDPSSGLGVCGDWLCGGRIEGAWRSGQALARALELQPPRRSACLAAG